MYHTTEIKGVRPASTQSLTTSSWKPVADGPKQFPVCIRALLSQHLKSSSIILHFPCVHERDPRLDSMKFRNTWDRVKVVLSKQLVLPCVGFGAIFGGHNNDQNECGCVQLMASHAHSCHTCVQTTGQYLSKGACRRGWDPPVGPSLAVHTEGKCITFWPGGRSSGIPQRPSDPPGLLTLGCERGHTSSQM